MSPYFLKRALISALVILALTGCSGKEARIESHLKKGEALLAQSDPDKAILEVRNVMQMDPKNAQAFYLGGQVEESRNELQRAYSSYAKALELKPDFYDAKAAMARLNFSIGADTEAQKMDDEVLANDPANAEALSVRAALIARKGDLDGAIHIAAGISNAGPLQVNPAILIARIYATNKDVPSALKVLDSALVTHPKDVALLGLAADLSRASGQLDLTDAYLRRATSAAPKNFRLWASWVSLYQDKGDADRAEAILRDSIKANPDESNRYLALVHLVSLRRGEEAGLKELLGFTHDRPKDYPLQFGLASYYKERGREADARKVYEQIVDSDVKGPASLTARNDLVALDLAEGDEPRAQKQLEEILKINARDSAALVMRGRLELFHKDLDSAVADLRAAAKDSPDSPQILELLADAYTASQQPAQARDTLADAVKLFPNRGDLVQVWIKYLARTGQNAEAIAAADNALERAPKDIDLYRTKASLQEQNKDGTGAESTLAKLETLYPRNVQIKMLQGQLFAREKKSDLALATFDKASALAPEAPEPRVAALELLVAQHRYPEAHKRVQAEMAMTPKRALNYQLQGNIYSAQGDRSAAEAAYRKAVELEPALASAYLNLANFLSEQNRDDDAMAALEQGVKASPQNGPLLAARAALSTKRGDYDRAIADYEDLVRRNPTDSASANNLAFLLAEKKGDPQSLDRALKLAKAFEFANDPRLLDTLAWTHYRMGQFSESVPILQRALAMAPSSQQLELHYGMALYKTGDQSQAQQYLRAASQGNSKLPDEARKMIEQG